MKTNRISILARAGSSFLLILLAAGCAGSPPAPTPADAMRDKSGASAEMAVQWDKGNQLVQTGERQVKEGEQQLRQAAEQRKAAEQLEQDARARIADGKNKVAQGLALKERIEQDYAETLPAPKGSTP